MKEKNEGGKEVNDGRKEVNGRKFVHERRKEGEKKERSVGM